MEGCKREMYVTHAWRVSKNKKFRSNAQSAPPMALAQLFSFASFYAPYRGNTDLHPSHLITINCSVGLPTETVVVFLSLTSLLEWPTLCSSAVLLYLFLLLSFFYKRALLHRHQLVVTYGTRTSQPFSFDEWPPQPRYALWSSCCWRSFRQVQSFEIWIC